MSRNRLPAIDSNLEVQQIARTLGITGPNLKAKLCDSAVDRVLRQMEKLDFVPYRLDDVHDLVLNMTRVQIERVANDADLARVSRKYEKTQAAIGVQLEFEFERKTEALVFRNEQHDLRSHAFTAVVDARGSRAVRAWFAERHEPAHLLVPDPSGKVAWRRTLEERPEPVEQVIDAIASAVGFWEPIVEPVLKSWLARENSILSAFEGARNELAPNASREACYRAFARLAPFPLTLLRTELASRRADKKNPANSLALRATTVIWNDAAEQAGTTVWQNFRIPVHSIIHEAREDSVRRCRTQFDDLNAWRSETSGPLSRRTLPVHVTACGNWAAIEIAE